MELLGLGAKALVVVGVAGLRGVLAAEGRPAHIERQHDEGLVDPKVDPELPPHSRDAAGGYVGGIRKEDAEEPNRSEPEGEARPQVVGSAFVDEGQVLILAGELLFGGFLDVAARRRLCTSR